MAEHTREQRAAVQAAIIAHQDRLAIIEGRGSGLLCTCGAQFPPRVPDDWLPTGYTQEEWDNEFAEEKLHVIDLMRIKSQTAARDFYDHLADMVLDAIEELAGSNAS